MKSVQSDSTPRKKAKDKLQLWNAVEKTDPAMTKRVSQRGGFTSIDAYSQLKEATKQFGPYGQGWGLKNVELDLETLASAGIAIYRAIFFFPVGEFPIINSILYKRKNGFDEEFTKKVETDTITKALSRLGFNADVFMGRFDDNRYVNQRLQEVAEAEAENNPDVKVKVQEAVCLIESISSKPELRKLPEVLKKRFPDVICGHPDVRNAYSQKRHILNASTQGTA